MARSLNSHLVEPRPCDPQSTNRLDTISCLFAPVLLSCGDEAGRRKTGLSPEQVRTTIEAKEVEPFIASARLICGFPVKVTVEYASRRERKDVDDTGRCSKKEDDFVHGGSLDSSDDGTSPRRHLLDIGTESNVRVGKTAAFLVVVYTASTRGGSSSTLSGYRTTPG